MAEDHISVKQVRSSIGTTPKHRGTLRALGSAGSDGQPSCLTGRKSAAWWLE